MPFTIPFDSQIPASDNEILQPLLDLFRKCVDGRHIPSCNISSLEQILPQRGISHEPGHLLFGYHPLGGLVMIVDLVASYCHEQGRCNTALFRQEATVGQLLDVLTEQAPEMGTVCKASTRWITVSGRRYAFWRK